jgi:hypothetical protein
MDSPKIFDMGQIGGKKFVCLNEKIKDMMKEYDAIQFEFKGQKLVIVNLDSFVLLLEKWKSEKPAPSNSSSRNI